MVFELLGMERNQVVWGIDAIGKSRRFCCRRSRIHFARQTRIHFVIHRSWGHVGWRCRSFAELEPLLEQRTELSLVQLVRQKGGRSHEDHLQEEEEKEEEEDHH